MKGKIFEIKHFAVHDGDGIRTTVFFKGCPLKCVWCHNPEGISFESQLAYLQNKCINCGECISICSDNAHKIKDNIHVFDRNRCNACGKCEDVCLGEAIKFYGKEMTVAELVPHLISDKTFYEKSGGGVTLSGGECLCQADFCAELLMALKKENIHTAVDTCGFVSRDIIDKVINYTDIFLYDLKAIDEKVHIHCTGQSNKIILDNLKYIDSCKKLFEVRVPFVPGFNDDQINLIANYLTSFKNLTKVKILPYHNFAGSKYSSLEMINTLPDILPDDYELNEAVKIFKEKGINAE